MANNPWQRGLPPEPPRRPPFGEGPTAGPSPTSSSSTAPPQGPPSSGRESRVRQDSPTQSTLPNNQRTSTSRHTKRFIVPAAMLLALLVVSSAIFFVTREGSDDQTVDERTGTTTASPTSTVSTSSSLPSGKWDQVARSVVYIEATGSQCGWTGSGSLVLDGSYVLTNQHVAGSGECDLAVFFTQSTSVAPTVGYAAALVVYDVANDLAVLRVFDSAGQPLSDSARPSLVINAAALSLGSTIYTLGYPAAGGSTITFTSGDYSGMDDVDGVYYKTTAYMNSGVSGGAALNAAGELIGVPTAGKVDPDTKENLGINLIRPISYATDLLAKAESRNLSSAAGGQVVAQAGDEEDILSTSGDSSSSDPIFDTCREAKQWGYGPYYSGLDYEYDYYFDRDGDGVVCE